MDLWAESLQDDVKKLKAEVARLQAEAVQLRHRLAERADAQDRLRERAEEAEADLARLRVKYSATHDCKEEAWAEAERLLAERDAALLGLGQVLSGADAEKPSSEAMIEHARRFIGLDAATAGSGGSDAVAP